MNFVFISLILESLGKENPEKRFINDNKEISEDKLFFQKVNFKCNKTGMNIIGVSTQKNVMFKRNKIFYFFF